MDESTTEERPAPYKPQDIDIDEEARLQADGTGENFHRYKEQKVTCLPVGIIEPVDKFEDIIKSELLLKNVQALGYAEMTPIQKWAMPAIMMGQDIIGCAQTGSGKTAAFLLPILQAIMKTDLETHDPNSDCQNPYCLIISPTRELANQLYTQSEMLSRDSIVACRVLYGQVSVAHQKSKISQGCHVLVATPGRLRDFVERGWIGFSNIKYVILDEGDRLVGDGFKESIKEFFDHPSMPPMEKRQTLFFSATFKPEIQTNAKEFLKDNFVFLAVGRVGAANEDIKQEFLQVARTEKKRELKKILSQVPESDKTIVFTQTKQAADMLATFFTQMNLSSTSIHGDRHQSQREEAISTFKKGIKRFLISSPVGNRGLDLPKVALVINYDLPENIDEYVHRIGRTGRAGHTGRAISFFDADRDREILPCLLKILEEAKQDIPEWMKNGDFSAGGSGGGDAWATGASGATDDWGATSGAVEDDWGSAGATADSNETPKPSTSAEADDWGSGAASSAPDNPKPTTPTESAESSGWGETSKAAGDSGWGNSDWGSSNDNKTNTSNQDKTDNSGWGNSSWGSSNKNDAGSSSWGGSGDNNRGGNSGWGGGGGNSWGGQRDNNRPERGRGNFRGGRGGNRFDGNSRGGFRNNRSDGDGSGGGGGGGSSWGSSGGNDWSGGERGNSRGRGRGGYRGDRGQSSWGGSRNDRSDSRQSGGGGGSSWGSTDNNDSGWGNSTSSGWGNDDNKKDDNQAKPSTSSWGSDNNKTNGSNVEDDWNTTPGDNKRKADEPAGNSPKRTDKGNAEAAPADDWGSGW